MTRFGVFVVAAAAIGLCAPVGADNSWTVVSPGFAGSEYKLQATLGSPSTSAYVQSDRPTHATYYKATYWIDPTGIQMPEGGTAVRYLNLVDEDEGGTDPVGGVITVGFLRLDPYDHQWHTTFWNRHDTGGYNNAANLALGTTFPVEVEIQFWRGPVGQTTFCAKRTADAASQICNATIDMEEADVDALRIGFFTNSNPANYAGSFTFDGLKSNW